MRLHPTIQGTQRDPRILAGFDCRGGCANSLAVQTAFTLIEMLLALAVSAIVLAGISGVFYSAMRLRERTVAAVDVAAPLDQALMILRRDLRGALPPGQGMTGDFRNGALNTSMGNSLGLQFSTTTGTIDDAGPWGDVQDVIYELREPQIRNGSQGRDLVRSVARNLLSTATIEWQTRLLLSNVEDIQFYCWDGVEWLATWDTSLYETNLPVAVKVRIQLADESLRGRSGREPLEMIVPLVCQNRVQDTNTTQTAGGQL